MIGKAWLPSRFGSVMTIVDEVQLVASPTRKMLEHMQVPWLRREITAKRACKSSRPGGGVESTARSIYELLHSLKLLQPTSILPPLLSAWSSSLTMRASTIVVLAWSLCCSAATLPVCGVCCYLPVG